MTILQVAQKAIKKGISVIPVKADGSKAPALPSWVEYQNNLATGQELASWFNNQPRGLAVIGGAVSGNLEILDFDEKEYFDKFVEAAKNTDLWGLVSWVINGYMEYTPNGVHLIYRCEKPVQGNLKLASFIDANGEKKTAIETRGKGGYAIIAPSNGRVHQSGKPYAMQSGSIETIVTLTADERDNILNLARSLTEISEKVSEVWKFDASKTIGGRPGDEFAEKVSWEEILTGWKKAGYSNGVTYWTRPGKSSGISASTGYAGTDYLYCFTTSTDLENNRAYSKFSAYATLEHGGDFNEAAKALKNRGFGSSGFKYEPTEDKKQIVDRTTGEIVTSPEIKQEINLANFEPDDSGNTEAFLSVYGSDFRYTEATGWLAWDGRCWNKDVAESLLDEKIIEVLKRRRMAAVASGKEMVVKTSIPNRGRINACKEGIRLSSRIFTTEKIFDSEKTLLNTINGVIDLKTGELLPHNREYYFTSYIPTEYKPDADPTEFLLWLYEVLENEETIEYLQQVIGYCLTGLTTEDSLFYLHGDARAGKSLFALVISTMMGSDLAKSVDFGAFASKKESDGNQFLFATLSGARAIFASESDKNKQLDTAKIKALTGGDPVTCCFKHKPHFQYYPLYKIIMLSNWPIKVDVDDKAVWARVKTIWFPKSFIGREDKELRNKLTQPEVLQGVLAWAVDGAIKWFANKGGLKTPDKIIKDTEASRASMDYVFAWLGECTERFAFDDPENAIEEPYWTSNEDVYRSYKKFSEDNGYFVKGMRDLSSSLHVKGYKIGEIRRVNGKVQRGVEGLKVL